jgi:hypothetical protein
MKLERDLQASHKSLTFKRKELLDIEEEQRKKLRWNR